MDSLCTYAESVPKNKHLITQQDIDAVKIPRLSLFNAAECLQIHNLHCTLLTKAMLGNNSDEVGLLVRLWDWSYILIFGKEHTISLKSSPDARELLLTSPARSLIFMHNHPRNTIFSEQDLCSFLINEAIMMVTVVCNNGCCYYLMKLSYFDCKAALLYYEQLYKDTQKSPAAREFLRTCSKVGLKFYYGGN